MKSIKAWYMENFPDDELGSEISKEATFEGLLSRIYNTYEYIGVYDTVVRERVFIGLSEFSGRSFESIYDEWLNG